MRFSFLFRRVVPDGGIEWEGPLRLKNNDISSIVKKYNIEY